MEIILKVPGLIALKPITSVFSKGSRSTSCLGNVQLLREAKGSRPASIPVWVLTNQNHIVQ